MGGYPPAQGVCSYSQCQAEAGSLGGRLDLGVLLASGPSLTDGADLRRGISLGLVECRELRRPLSEHALVRDRVPAIDRLGLVPDHLHRGRPWNSSPFKVPDCRSAEIVRDSVWDAGETTSRLPRSPKLLDRFPVPVEEPGNDGSGGLLQFSGPRYLRLQDES